MSSDSASDRLFDAFPAVPTKEWEDQIRRDLRGADYAETLLWKTRDGIALRPYYRSDDLDRLEHLREDRLAVEMRGEWQLQQNVRLDNLASDESLLQQVLDGGVDVVGIEIREESIARDAEKILGRISSILSVQANAASSIHLEGGLESARLFELLISKGYPAIEPDTIRGSIGYDPLAALARHGTLARHELDYAATFLEKAGSAAPGVRLLRAGTNAYHDGGATVVQETAMALASLSEYLAQLVERGRSIREVLKRLYLDVSVSTSFYEEVAKLRALRLLIPQLIRAFSPEESAYRLPIHARMSIRSMTRYDPHTNLLRATTEAASAVIGGCDVLLIHPFDGVHGAPSALGLRLARNVHHLIRHESLLGQVDDPAAGSYYIEVLTDAVARRAWENFKAIEERGGLLAALEDGFVQKELRESREQVQSDVASGRRALVGTNVYPNPEERLEDMRSEGRAVGGDSSSRTRSESTGLKAENAGDDYIVDPIPPFRESEEVERARMQSDAEEGRSQ